MTTAELITLTRDRFGEDSTTATQVTNAQILSFLNESQVELCADSDVLVSCWTASTVNAQQQYSVPPEYTSVESIHLYRTTGTQSQIWLDKVGIDELDPRKATGNPTKFALWGLNVSGDNSPAFWLDPIPNSSGTEDLECYGRQLPKTMVSGGQAPEVRARWQYALSNGAIRLIYLRMAMGDPTFLPLADRAAAIWANDKAEAKQQVFVDIYRARQAKDTMGYVVPRYA